MPIDPPFIGTGMIGRLWAPLLCLAAWCIPGVGVAHDAVRATSSLRLDRHVTAPSPFKLEISRSEYRLSGTQSREKPHQEGVSRLVEKHAGARRLDPELVHAVIRAESAYRADAISPKGAVGLMQVMPTTGRRFGVSDLASPESNLLAGTAYLRHLLDRFDNLPLALAAYNAGEGAVIRAGGKIPAYPETRGYVQTVMRNYQERVGAGLNESRIYVEGVRLADSELALYRLSPEVR